MLFIAILKYTKTLDAVDQILPEHRTYLNKLLDAGKLLVAGRINPRTGAVIIAKNVSRSEFEKILANDPITKLCEFEIIEFAPTFSDECLRGIIEK